jgi:hypothetical protein
MVSVTQETLVASNELALVSRPARALVGWLQQQEGQLLLAQRQMQHANRPEYAEKVQKARAAVQARPVGVDQSKVLSEIPGDLTEHVEKFAAHDAFKPFAAEGWSFKIADLSKVCALQPIVFSDHAEERAQSATAGDIGSLAAVTLPIPGNTTLPIQFDQQRNTWDHPVSESESPHRGPLCRPGGGSDRLWFPDRCPTLICADCVSPRPVRAERWIPSLHRPPGSRHESCACAVSRVSRVREPRAGAGPPIRAAVSRRPATAPGRLPERRGRRRRPFAGFSKDDCGTGHGDEPVGMMTTSCLDSKGRLSKSNYATSLLSSWVTHSLEPAGEVDLATINALLWRVLADRHGPFFDFEKALRAQPYRQGCESQSSFREASGKGQEAEPEYAVSAYRHAIYRPGYTQLGN